MKHYNLLTAADCKKSHFLSFIYVFTFCEGRGGGGSGGGGGVCPQYPKLPLSAPGEVEICFAWIAIIVLNDLEMKVKKKLYVFLQACISVYSFFLNLIYFFFNYAPRLFTVPYFPVRS